MKSELNEYKRSRILEVASELFYERGFVGTTIDAIVGKLEVKKPFIYQYFKSKHEILAAVVEREMKRVIDLLDLVEQRERTPSRRLCCFVEAWVRENIEFRMIAVIFWQEHHHFLPDNQKETRLLQKVLTSRLTSLIEEGVVQGEFNVENPRLAAFALMGIAQWIPRWYRSDGEFEVDEICHYFASQSLRIVGAAMGESRNVGLVS